MALTLAGCGVAGSHPARRPAATASTTPGATATASVSAAALKVTGKATASLAELPEVTAPLDLTGIQFISAADGWAVGSRCVASSTPCQGVLLATHDGGATWTASSLPSGLDGVQFLDAKTGWAYGAKGLFATTDGGATWKPLPLPAKARTDASVQVSFADARHGWLIVHLQSCATQGCGLVVYATADGGASWREVASNALPGRSAQLPWAEFGLGGDLGGGRGWLMASIPAAIVKTTTDGGAHWATKVVDTGGAPSGGGFTPSGVGWIAATSPSVQGRAEVWRTPDFGGTWKQVASLPGRVAAVAISPDGASAWVTLQPGSGCLSSPCSTRVAVVSPSGAVSGPQPADGYSLLDLSVLSAQTAWAVATGNGPGYAVIVTHDGGKTWQARHRTATAPSPGGLWGFWDAQRGWALGSRTDPGVLLTTTDGGAIWSDSGRTPASDLSAGGFLDATHGWAVVDGMKAYATADGGATWQPLAEANSCQGIQLMGFTTPKDGWLLPQAMKCNPVPQLAVTHDGGAAWTTVQSDVRWLTVAFGTPNSGWAVGRRGGEFDLYTTTDGGATWKPIAAFGPQQWNKPDPLWVGAQLAAAGPEDVWLASQTRLLHSTDGGRTWTETQTGGPQINRVTAAPDGAGWVQVGPRIYRVDGSTWTQVAWAAGS